MILNDHAAIPDAGEPQPVEGSGGFRARLRGRNIVLIGMMGAGKSSIGRRLGRMLGLDFLDADHEIEEAAGMSIPEIFSRHGEAYFRDGERRVLARLLEGGPAVIATGGGAWVDARTRALAADRSISVWLKADPEILLKRVRRRGSRPLLMNADPEGTLRRLLAEREPLYATADIIVNSRDVPHETMSDEVLDAIRRHVEEEGARA
jgi:shikimate kinase